MNRSQLKKKIVIGTANFTQNYGLKKIKVKQGQIIKIFNLAKKHKISKIDTADAYFKKNNILQRFSKKFEFITKIKLDERWTSLEFCEEEIERHLKSLSCNRVEIFLIHDVKILFNKNGLKIFKNLELLKKKYFKKIGLSIYEVDQLDFLTSNYNLDVIQCPFNIIDKRILNTGWFEELKKLNIEIHARSIFLQGLLVNEFFYKKKYFKKWEYYFLEWFQWLKSNKISPIDYCLTDLLKYDFDQIIVGINDYNNLKEIINFKKIKKNNKFFSLNKNDLKLIDPRNWQK